jgi:hypothetical protein
MPHQEFGALASDGPKKHEDLFSTSENSGKPANFSGHSS